MSKNKQLDWSKTAKQFSLNSCGKCICQYQATRRAGKQALGLESSFLRILDTFHPPFYVVILVKFTVLFVLGKCLMGSEQVILIFTEVWPYSFHVSR